MFWRSIMDRMRVSENVAGAGSRQVDIAQVGTSFIGSFLKNKRNWDARGRGGDSFI